MSLDSSKIFRFVNPLLACLAVFNVALTLYVCTQFYAYLPTSDTWVYVDFLARAAQGHLDFGALLERHNGTHVIALPKLVYFFDVRLTQGSGTLTVVVSLLAQLGSAVLFLAVIKQLVALNKNQKFFLGITSAIFLLSACQVESLLNPANLQWSLLVFSASFTAWSLVHYLKENSAVWIAAIALGVLMTGLTSASPFLVLIPLAIIFSAKLDIKKFSFTLLALSAVGCIAMGLYVFQQNISAELILFLTKNVLVFMVDFMAPPVERLRFMPMTILTGALLLLAFWRLFRKKQNDAFGQPVFFIFLLWFALTLIVATAAFRSISPSAFTFRFVNIGLLFSLTLIVCLYLQLKTQRFVSIFIVGVFAYVWLLSYVNYKEASAFGFGRNHVRLNQVAYALDIREPGVVSALPGTIWEKQDYDFVQAYKHKLKDQAIGIYSDPIYRQVGSSITSFARIRQTQACEIDILKMRRLLPEQAAYKLTGKANSHDGKNLSRVVFADSEGIIRGFAIPVVSSRDLWQGTREGKHWSGFVNLDKAGVKESLKAYAYSSDVICEPQTVGLPVFQPFVKKEKKN